MAAKKKPQVQLHEKSIESKYSNGGASVAKNIGADVMKSFWDEFLLGGAQSTKDMIMGDLEDFSNGKKANKMSGDLKPGQEVNLKAQEKQEKKAAHQSQHQEYFREINNPEQMRRAEQQAVVRKIDEILVELKKLANSSAAMQILYKDVASENMPVTPGTYHVNFFEWVLIVMRSARQKMDESSSWLAQFASKKKQRQYGNMAKKHGTSFTLSSERSTATQTG